MNKYFLLVLLCLSLNNLYAQKYKEMMADMDINFYDVCAEAEAYFKTIDKDQKGSGYKNYLRWKQENESRYAPDGVRNNVSPYFVQEQYEQFLNQQKKTRAIHNNWRELGPRFIDTITGHYAAGLGRVEDVFVDKNNTNKVYLGTRSGGFWRTINGGTSWQGTTDTLFASGVNAITASPTNSDSVLINCRNASNGTSHGIYRSINGGLTWTITNFNPTSLGMGGLGSNFQVYKIYYHPTVSNLIFVGTNEGLYRSTNNLQTWTQIQAGADITQIEFHPTNPNIMYIYDNTSGGANENKVLVSTNMGVSFTPSAVITGNSNNTIFLSTSNQCPNCLYVGSNGGVWKSIDSGKNYTLISNPNQSIRAIAVNTFDTSKIVAGYVDLFNSFNGGQNFNQCTFWSLGNSAHNANSFAGAFDSSSVYIHADANIMKCINGVFYAGTDGYIAKSSDNGVSWQRISEGVGSREYYCLGTSQNNHFVTMCGSQDNGESIRNQNGWIEFYGADGMEGIIHPLNEDWIIGSVQYGNRRRTKNGGYTQDGASPNVSDGAWVAPLAYNPTNPMQLFDFTDSVMRSDNFGTSWNYVGKPFNGNITSAAIAENNSNIMVVSFNSNIYKSIDAGVTYTNIKNNLPTYTITDIAFDPTNDDIIVVTYNRYQNDGQKVFITTNGGSNWVNITHNLGNMPIKSVVIDHSSKHNIYVGAEIGIYVKAMNDTTWQLYSTKLPNVTVNELEINYGSNTLKAATWGRGLWENALINRKDYPAITHTTITTPPTDDFPRINVDQFITSKISYTGTITKAWVAWAKNSIVLNNTILMTNTIDSTWLSNTAIPSTTAGDNIYFKVFAVGTNNDTTETYRFMYTINPSEYCTAAGTQDAGNLYISNVTIDAINNTTLNDSFTLYTNPILNLYPATTYTLNVFGNTGWSENDYAAWIDFNGDKYFDPNKERVLYKPNGSDSASAIFSLPSSYNGNDTFRMRIRLSYWGTDPLPCGIQFGEVEDYTIRMHYPSSIENNIANSFSLSPNPVNTNLLIKGNFIEKEITILNLYGQECLTQKITNNSTQSINVSHLPKGVYFVAIGKATKKFIKD